MQARLPACLTGAALVVTLAALPQTAYAAGDVQFTGATDDSWNVATNWNPGRVPLADDDVKINVATKSPTLSAGADGVANSVTVAGPNTVIVDGAGSTLTIGAGASAL